MNDADLDRWSRRLGERLSRRVLHGLTAGGLMSIVPHEAPKAKKKKPKKRCVPKPNSVTCKGKCGPTLNNCKKTVNLQPVRLQLRPGLGRPW